MGGVLPTTSLDMMAAWSPCRHFVVILQGHDEHGIRVFLEFYDVGRPADDIAVGRLAERRLVDRAVAAFEAS